MTSDFAILCFFLTYNSISGPPEPMARHENATLLPHLDEVLSRKLTYQPGHFQFKEGADQF